MYIGHVGAALAGKRARATIALWVLLVATYAPDWVDTGMCIMGRYSGGGMLSHSIPAVLLFALAGLVAYGAATRDWTGAIVVAAVVVSHMFLDWITGYKPTWPGGPMIGLRLYGHPLFDFLAEGVVILVGALLYLPTLPSRQRRWTEFAFMAGILLALQLSIDIAHLLMKSLPKC